MPFCATKAGTLRLVWQGEELVLDGNGRDLPTELAEDIRGHVNVVVEASPSPAPSEPEPEVEDEPVSEEKPRRNRRSG